MSKEPEWEAYDPQIAWEWHDWAEKRIEQLLRDIQILNTAWDQATKSWQDEVALRQRKCEALVEWFKTLLDIPVDMHDGIALTVGDTQEAIDLLKSNPELRALLEEKSHD